MTEREIREHLAEAQRARPALPAADAAFIARVKATVRGGTVNWGDLLLAEACAKGDARALAELEARVMPAVKRAIGRLDSSPAFVDEALQAVRERLLTPGGDGPRIRQYVGEGPLAAWVRVAGVRIALNLRRGKGDQPQASTDDLDVPLPQASPELAVMREHVGQKLSVALADALALLTPEDRNLLRLHLVEGLTLERLGKMLDAHKSTLSRRLVKLESTLVSGTREALKRRFGIRARELHSVMKVFSSRVDVDVKRLLQQGAPQDRHRDGEVDDQAADVDEGGDERG